MKLNKGEWGEPYVALRLLGDGRLRMADEDGNSKPDEWMDVIELIREETTTRVVSYRRDPESTMVDISINGVLVATLPASDFLINAEQLEIEIKSGKGPSFEVSEDTNNFFLLAEMLSLKAKSGDKSDIYLTTLDPRSAITRKNIGFSIKSKFGHNPTLFNTAPASGVRYRIEGMTDDLMDEVNSLVDRKGHAAVMARCALIKYKGCTPVYVGYAMARKAKCEAFKENLDVIDSRLPRAIEWLLYDHFFECESNVSIPFVVDKLIEANPCKISRPDIKYPYMIKSFLYAAYSGMTASTLWDGEAHVNGGFITVNEDGSVLANYALESEEFKGYLFKNCYLEFPATSERHGDYAKVYKQDGEYYFHLNFQIRYR